MKLRSLELVRLVFLVAILAAYEVGLQARTERKRSSFPDRDYTACMPRPRCLWCMEPPYQDVAVLKWRGEERERLTVPLCRKHLQKLKEAGAAGKETKGWFYKTGWW